MREPVASRYALGSIGLPVKPITVRYDDAAK
jgi:hypothetical protein